MISSIHKYFEIRDGTHETLITCGGGSTTNSIGGWFFGSDELSGSLSLCRCCLLSLLSKIFAWLIASSYHDLLIVILTPSLVMNNRVLIYKSRSTETAPSIANETKRTVKRFSEKVTTRDDRIARRDLSMVGLGVLGGAGFLASKKGKKGGGGGRGLNNDLTDLVPGAIVNPSSVYLCA